MSDREQTEQTDGREPVIAPNKTEAERVKGLLRGDLDTEELPEEKKTERPVVVGIGSSAGGLEAMSAFFDALPPDTGLTFVVVSHLSPDHPSVLDELLQRHTAMPVLQVQESRVRIQPNHVYVVPPNHQLVLTDAHLHAAEFEGPRAGRAPIDVFFRSLAAMHANPVGILMSGGGSDGALGLRSVKEAGGLVMVQDPDEAAHDSMPNSAIATGVVDLVLPARGLAQRLVEVNRRRIHVPSDPTQLSPEQQDTLQRILTQLNTRTGHDFRAYKQSTVLRRIQRRMQITGYETLEGYLPFLRQSADEGQALLGDLLIGVTNFFRDEESWASVAHDVIPNIFSDKGRDEVVRVWSIGCSTGEEAYSMAILMMEHAATLDEPPGIQVFATDLDENSLAKAREGYYPDSIAADVSAERLQRFFTKEGSYYRVRREVRDNVLFAAHSVLRDPPFSRLSLVACRNLLIYLQRTLQDNLFEVFHYALQPGGYLFLGNSETADSAGDLFQTVDKKHRIYQAREWSGQHRALPSLPLISRHQRPVLATRAVERRPPPQDVGVRAMYERTLEEYGPPTVLVDDEFNVIRLSGTAGRYLRIPDGPPTNNLTRLVREELQFELRSGLFQAFDRGLSSVSAPLPINEGGREQRVFISVWPRAVPGDQRLALVVFVEDQSVRAPATAADSGAKADRDTLQQLESEVRHLRERLQATVEEYETSNEELKAANEELQSINEEYRSTTEELETSKEELQSVNEELETVNNELKVKLEEISRAHSDLQNLLTATEIATLFLDRDMRIQRFTTGVEDLFNIMRSDRGRPIGHLTHKLDYPELVGDASQVLRTLVPLEREARHANGDWYLARLRPYRTIDDRIEGVVITFVNVTAMRRMEHDAERARGLLDLALGAARMGWSTLDMATGAAENDARARELLGFAPDEELTITRWLERVHPDDRDRVAEAMQRSLNTGDWMDLEYRVILPEGALRYIHGTGTFVRDEDSETPLWTGLIRDVTERTRLAQSLREAREFRDMALASAEMGWGTLDARTNEVDWDERGRAIMGFTPDERISLDRWIAGIHPDDRPAVEEGLVALERDGAPFDVEYRYRRPDGQERIIHGTALLRPSEGSTDGVLVGTLRDVTEQRRAAEALAEARENLEMALWSANLGWGVSDIRTGELTQDARARAITGLPAEGPLALEDYLALIHPDDMPRIAADGEARRRGEKSEEAIEYRIIRPDGQERIIRGTGQLRRDAAGEPWQLTGTLQDVTEQRRTEAELRRLTASLEQAVAERTEELRLANAELSAAHGRFLALFQASPVPTVILDPADSRYLDANPAFVEYMGKPREELIGRRGDEVVYRVPTLENPEALAAEFAATGRLLSIETQFEITPGDERTTLTSFVQVTLDGQPRLLATMTDITDRKRTEQLIAEQRAALEATNVELTAARDRFQALFHVNPVPSTILDMEELSYVDANQAYLDFYGLTREQVVGRSMLNGGQWPDQAARQRVVDQFVNRDRTRNNEITIKLPSGEERTLLISDGPLELDGRPCTLTTFIDITERKRAEEQVRQLASELTLAEQAERQRVSSILHDDLQQRLYALQIQLAEVQARALKGEYDTLPGGISSMRDALSRSLEVTRRLSVDLSPPILEGEGLAQALGWLGSQMAADYGLRVHIEQGVEWRTLEQGLRIALFQIVRELLFNVVKHAGVGEVTVTLTQDSAWVKIEVSDDGNGFDAVTALTSPAGQNHGLRQAQRRVEFYGGRLDIESSPGQGTRVIIKVPLAEEMLL